MGERIKKIHNDVELDRFHPNDAENLLAFNITKKRIVDLCNKGFEEDPVNGGVKTCQWGGAKVGQLVPRLGA
jgi:hypothetical protein